MVNLGSGGLEGRFVVCDEGRTDQLIRGQGHQGAVLGGGLGDEGLIVDLDH